MPPVKMLKPRIRRDIWSDKMGIPTPSSAMATRVALPGYLAGLPQIVPGITDTYAATNLITNGGFETPGAGGVDTFASGWEEVRTVIDETTIINSGAHSCKLVNEAGTGLQSRVQQTITVIPGRQYTLSLWERGDGTNNGAYAIYDITNSVFIVNQTSLTASTTWTPATQLFTAPSTCTSIRIYCYGSPNSTGGTVYFDDVSVYPTSGLLSISGGQLVCAGGKATPSEDDPVSAIGTNACVTGKSFWGKFIYTSGRINYFGLNFGIGGAQTRSAIRYIGSKLYAYNGTTSTEVGGVITAGVEYQFMLIPQNQIGAICLIKGGSQYPQWTVLYVTNNTSLTGNLYELIGNYDGVFTVPETRLLQLPAPFNADYGIATQRLAGARSVGDTFTHEADFFLEWTVTNVGSSGQSTISFRQQSTNDRWSIANNNLGEISLYEKVSGSANLRGSGAAGSIANGQRMCVIADGATIKVYANNVLKITYASATNFQTLTGGELISLGTGGAISDIVSYPLRPQPHLQNLLNAFTR